MLRIAIASASASDPVMATPKRRKANGRRAYIEMIDVLLGEESNIQRLRDQAQEAFTASPLQFVQDFVSPLISKSMIEDSDDRTPAKRAQDIRDALEEMDAQLTVADDDATTSTT